MQKSPRNFHKIYTGTKHVNKANKNGFTILSHFTKYLCNKQHFRQQAQNRGKTLTNMRDSCKPVVPLERTLHKESSKICFGILRAVHKLLSI